MSILDKIKNRIEYYFLSKVKPEIIGGYKNENGNLKESTGISNLTHISNQDENLFIDNNVFIGHFNYIDAYNAKVTISKNVQITNYVSILTHSSHNEIRMGKILNTDLNAYNDLLKIGDIYIGPNSYIGPHTVIMPGTTIGKGCIVSAYSYVSGEFPDFSIIRGIPAKIIGSTKDIDFELLKKYPEFKQSYYLNNEIN